MIVVGICCRFAQFGIYLNGVGATLTVINGEFSQTYLLNFLFPCMSWEWDYLRKQS